MKFRLLFLCALLTLLGCQQTADYTRWVNPFVGTGESGNCYPGAQAPFGMISISPNTAFDDYDHWYARPGYKYDRDEIVSFTSTHLSGVGCHAMQDIPFMPTIGLLERSPVNNREAYKSKFSHQHEEASPGYYRTTLLSTNIDVETTVSTRAGLVRFTYPETRQANLVFAPTNSANGISGAKLVIDPKKNEISGWVRTGGFCWRDPNLYPYFVYFSAVFDVPFSAHGTWLGEEQRPETATAQGTYIAAYLTFDAREQSAVTMNMAISYVSVENARLNRQTEIPHWDFEQVQKQTQASWNQHLQTIKIKGASEPERTTFYSALYHNMLQPSIFQDVNGEYIGFDDEIHTIDAGRDKYANFSLWDTYRTTAQLQAMLFPKRTSDMLHSLLLDSQQARGGGLPIWSMANTDNGCMNGYSAAPFIANAYAFGARNIDMQATKNKLVETAMSYHPIKDSRGWEGIEAYKSLGYVPYDEFQEACVSMTVEYSVADYAIAQFCRAAGDDENYAYFRERSKNVFNLFHPDSKFLQPRYKNGSWITPFDSTHSPGYVEGNANHYTWSVPQHAEELIERMGGQAAAQRRLDQFMSKILTRGWFVNEPHYWMGNEPCFGIPFLYPFLDAPESAQFHLDRIIKNFGPGPEGLVGDDDVGAMSALYIFSVMGLYPAIPGECGFVVTGPRFGGFEIRLANENTLRIIGQNAGPQRPFVQSMQMNGTRLSDYWLPAEDLLQNGGTLTFVMDTARP